MIGVFTHDRDRRVVAEFFELFKTPWEWGNHEKRYDALLVSDDVESIPEAPVVIIYGSSTKKLDERYGLRLEGRSAPLLKWRGQLFPVYQEVAVLDTPGEAILEVDGTQESAGARVERAGRRIFRFGYDLFREIETLLLTGQPARYASIPTLDLHIGLLRESILSGDVPVVEIPPVPAGYPYAVCLTHDIDFLRLRDHLFDSTMLGFVYRASLGSFIRLLKGRISPANAFRNQIALLKLPLVWIGLCPDFWQQIPLYMELEQDCKSTFFFIPFAGRPGVPCGQGDHERRAARYDLEEQSDLVKALVEEGFEAGVHGIDAWTDGMCAMEERRRFESVCGNKNIGIRMHWLYWSEDSFRHLDEAGFDYDSTFGYNDAIGYRAGTVQAYRPPAAVNLLELPLTVQDTSLFYPGRMNLPEKDAATACDRLLAVHRRFGGVLTLSWHDRSLVPERLWGDFYRELLNKVKTDGAWIGPAGQAVRWFRKRRAMVFDRVERLGDSIEVVVSSMNNLPSGEDLPGILLRVHLPLPEEAHHEASMRSRPWIDVPAGTQVVTRVALRQTA
jgi:hypothetical protein